MYRIKELIKFTTVVYYGLCIKSTWKIYNLIYNASLLVEEGNGYALTLDRLINTTGHSPLCFKPLEPKLQVGLTLVWKKYHLFSRAAEYFIKTLRQEFETY